MWKWLGFVGLAIELLGFILMAWDLLPEYRLYQQERTLRRYRGLCSTDWFKLENAAFEQDEADGQKAAVVTMLHRMRVADLRMLLSQLKVAGELPSPPEPAEYARRMDAAGQALAQRATDLHVRQRPPLRLAIGVVIVGVLVQLLGSIPVTLR